MANDLFRPIVSTRNRAQDIAATNFTTPKMAVAKSCTKVSIVFRPKWESTYLLVLSLRSKQRKHVWSVNGDALSPRPLTEQLCTKTKIDSVEIVGHEEYFANISHETLSHGCLLLFLELLLDSIDLRNHVLIGCRQTPHSCKIDDCVLILTFLDQEARRFVIEEGQDEDDSGEHDMKRCWDNPRIVGVLVDVEAASP